jgi:hypothetical protein
MTKTLTLLVAGTALAAASITTPTTAEARWGGPGPFFGGLVLGGIIGGALAAPYYYGPPGAYYGRPVYGPPPGCFRRVWNGYRWTRAYVC